jgi:phage terminase large subunit-like protein
MTLFDEIKAQRAIKFIELLKHTGDYHGVPFVLWPWERQIVGPVYGTLRKNGIRLYRTVYIEIAKKNGKSELMGGVANKHIFDKTEPNAAIYGCAGDRAQASIIFDTAVEMILQEETLKAKVDKGIVKINDSYKLIKNKETGSFYKVLSAESFTKHGYRPSIVLFDELHAQPNRDLWDTMTKGSFLTRKQPLLWVITTAGDDPDRVSIGWEIHEKAEKILSARKIGDPKNDISTWLPVIYSYQGEDIYNESNWAAANPSMGLSLRVEDLRELADEAKLSPADERTFRWLNLNQWITTKLSGWLPIDLFDSTVGEWSREELAGKICYLGLDLSTTTDLSALCAVFPPQDGDDWRVIWELFIPAVNMKERIRVDHVPYDTWAADGWITATEGSQIDYTVIEAKIQEYRKLYKVRELDADRSFATMLLQRLEQDRLLAVDIPQKYETLTDPIQITEVLLRSKKMTHENNPVARWCFGNTSIAKNGNAQIKFVKEHKGKSLDRTKRIDATVAWVCAMSRAKFYKTAGGVYDRHGVRTVGGGRTEDGRPKTEDGRPKTKPVASQ